MRSQSSALVLLVAFLAACGSEEPPPPAGSAGNEKREVEAGPTVAPEVQRATFVGKFITSEGEHAVTADGKFVIHVVREGDRLNYRLQVIRADSEGTSSNQGSSTMGPTAAAIDPDSKWFIHVESPDRYWVFDGDDEVTVIEYAETSPRKYELTMVGLEKSPGRVLATIPEPVRERLPAEVLERRK